MAGKPKYYAVRIGRKPGIYLTWDECSEQVAGFPGAVYKGLASRAEAESFLAQVTEAAQRPKDESASSVTPKEVEVNRAGKVSPVMQLPLSPGTETSSRPSKGPRLKKVELYTDGGCSRNPGPGGYGVVIISGAGRRELSGGFRRTTNNRMELMACIVGFQELGEKSDVTIWTDSQYLVNSISKGWAKRWQKAGWLRQNQEVPNADLWQQLLELLSGHRVAINWLRGHAGHKENERCDQLASEAMRQANLPLDTGYLG